MILPYQLALLTRGMLSQECLQISLLLGLQPVQHTFSTGSSLWALAQSVTCISTDTHPAVTHTSFLCYGHFQPLWGHSLWPYEWHLGLLHLGWTVQPPGWGKWWCSSACLPLVLSHPFWYSNWKLNLARAPTHWWPVASKLGVVMK